MTTRESKGKRSPNWTDNEVNILLEIWKEYKKKLTDKKRNHRVYEEMSNEMAGYYCYRTADEIRTKIGNMSKRFKYERAQEIIKGARSEWRFYWQVDEVLGLHPNFCVEYVKDNISKKKEECPGEENRATILMFKYPVKNEESAEVDENDDDQDMQHGQSLMCDKSHSGNCQPSKSAGEGTLETKDVAGRFLEDLLQEYKETKESLLDTDKRFLELLSNQNDLIKTQNELCQTQNTILKALLKKMD